MDTIEQGAAALFQLFSGADIGLDHQFFDQLVRVEAGLGPDTGDAAIFSNLDLALWQFVVVTRVNAAANLGARYVHRVAFLMNERVASLRVTAAVRIRVTATYSC